MTDYNKPISSSNPPESRGKRGAKDELKLTIENTVTGENNADHETNVVYEPLVTSSSPARKNKNKGSRVQPTQS